MRPRTALQKKVAALSESLPPLTSAQVAWVKRNAFSKEAYRCKKNTWCASCGHTFSNDLDICPHCGAKLKVVESRATKKQEKVYTTIHTTCKGFQVARHFFAKRLTRKNQEPQYEISECVQIWIDPEGRQTIMARPCYYQSFYVDLWNFNEPMSIKEVGSRTSYCYRGSRYDIFSFTNRICRVLPIINRNGFKGYFHNITPTELFSLLLSNPLAETLIKTKQYELLRHLSKVGKINHPHAVNICNRNGYIVQDASLWCDYIELLEWHHLDTHNAHYVCPPDLQQAHDRLLQRKNVIEKRKELEEKRKEAKKWEKQYREQKGKFFGITFGDGKITISVLTSVDEFAVEGTTMHHCVFGMGYYKRPDSLILSAHDQEGNRIETVEINLKTFQVVQSRGVCNKNTEYHKRIVDLCNKNMHMIKAVA